MPEGSQTFPETSSLRFLRIKVITYESETEARIKAPAPAPPQNPSGHTMKTTELNPVNRRRCPRSVLKTLRMLATSWLLVLSTLNSQLSTFGQGTAFTYQGRLSQGSGPVNGNYDFSF